MGNVTAKWLQEKLGGKLPEDEVKQIVKDYLRATVIADTTGGGPLLGLNGVVCKGHGRSKAPEVANTIGTAKKAIELDLVGTMKTELTNVRSKLNIPNV